MGGNKLFHAASEEADGGPEKLSLKTNFTGTVPRGVKILLWVFIIWCESAKCRPAKNVAARRMRAAIPQKINGMYRDGDAED